MNPQIHLIVTGRNTKPWLDRHMAGLLAQTGCEWRCTWIDDASDDGTQEAVEALDLPPHVRPLFRQSRRGAAENLREATLDSDPEEVVVWWDGDDLFAHSESLARIATVFSDPSVWLTYGGFLTWPGGISLYSGAYPEQVVRENAFRRYGWLCAPPRAFRSWLFKELSPEDLLDDNGHPWEMTYDQALLLPMLELAGSHSRHIPDILYLYNMTNPASDYVRDQTEQLATRERVRSRTPKTPIDSVKAPDMTTMINRWAPRYSGGRVVNYGPIDSYLEAEAWLTGLHVEDWGCGCAKFKELHKGPYFGVDGTPGWADHVADLTTHRSSTEGLLLRHVLEHNHDWRAILRNAIASFTKRLALVVFTPDSGIRNSEKVIGHVGALGVDDLALPHWTIEHEFLVQPCEVVTKTHLPTATGYSGETIWLVEKR